MFEFLMNPWILLMILAPVFLLVGINAGNFTSQPRKNRVLKIDPNSYRALELEVKSEDAVNIFCDAVGNTPNQRFVKRLSPFNVARKGFLKIYNYALWMGRYGTAYVQKFDNESVDLSFKEAVFNVFGQKFYDLIPQAVRDHIEDGSIEL